MKTVLFFRDFHGFTGGHLKVWHYFNHVKNHKGFQSKIAFTPTSRFGPRNPWLEQDKDIVSINDLHGDPDVLFLAGMDWKIAPEMDPDIPVINFIQHVRHADPNHPLFEFLPRKAIRICVSNSVLNVLKSTGLTNGPLYCIPNGIEDLSNYKLENTDKEIDLFICCKSNEPWAQELLEYFTKRNNRVHLHIKQAMTRKEFLENIAKAHLAVFLPDKTEGFYLPALEAMGLGIQVVCPDVQGNSDFCLSGITAVVPEKYDFLSLRDAVEVAMNMSDQERETMLNNGQLMVKKHNLTSEKQAFSMILDKAQPIWNLME